MSNCFNIYGKGCVFCIELLCPLLKLRHICVSPFLGSLFCPINLCVCLPMDYTHLITATFSLEIAWTDSSHFILLFQSYFFAFHMHFGIRLSMSTKSLVGILINVTLNLHNSLGRNDILSRGSLPIQENSSSLHLFMFIS
jgi:hypothetical protein